MESFKKLIIYSITAFFIIALSFFTVSVDYSGKSFTLENSVATVQADENWASCNDVLGTSGEYQTIAC